MTFVNDGAYSDYTIDIINSIAGINVEIFELKLIEN